MVWETEEELETAWLGGYGPDEEREAEELLGAALDGEHGEELQAAAREMTGRMQSYIDEGRPIGADLAAELQEQEVADDIDPDELAAAEARMVERVEQADRVGLIDAEFERLEKHVGRTLTDKEIDELLPLVPAAVATGDSESLDLVRDHGERLKGALDNTEDRLEIAVAAARRVQDEGEEEGVRLPPKGRQARVEAARESLREDPELSAGLEAMTEGMSESERYALRGEAAAELATEEVSVE